jgi:hypothetical protein
MHNLNDIELSRQHRGEVARQVENNRLAGQLRVARHGIGDGSRNALLGRVFARFPRKGQAVEC